MKNVWKFLVCRITYSYFISNFSLYLKGTFDILHSEVYTDRKYEVKTLTFFSMKFYFSYWQENRLLRQLQM